MGGRGRVAVAQTPSPPQRDQNKTLVFLLRTLSDLGDLSDLGEKGFVLSHSGQSQFGHAHVRIVDVPLARPQPQLAEVIAMAATRAR